MLMCLMLMHVVYYASCLCAFRLLLVCLTPHACVSYAHACVAGLIYFFVSVLDNPHDPSTVGNAAFYTRRTQLCRMTVLKDTRPFKET